MLPQVVDVVFPHVGTISTTPAIACRLRPLPDIASGHFQCPQYSAFRAKPTPVAAFVERTLDIWYLRALKIYSGQAHEKAQIRGCGCG